MREKALVQKEIRDEEQAVASLEKELAAHEVVLEPQIKPLREKIRKLNGEKGDIEKQMPKASPLFTVGIVAFVALAVANLFFIKWSGIITIVALALAVATGIAKSVVTKKLRKPFLEAQGKKDEEIKKINSQIADIRATDPQIAEIESKIYSHDSKADALKEELKDILLAEKIGTNNLIVSLNNSGAVYGYFDSESKHRTTNYYCLHIKVDGRSCGDAANPCSIIPLGPGIHTVSFEFDANVDGTTYEKPNIQFSLKDNNKYFSFKKPFSYTRKQGFTVEENASTDLEAFLKHAGISRSEFDSYVNSL